MALPTVENGVIPLELTKLSLRKLGNNDVEAYYQINKPSNLVSRAQLSKPHWPKLRLDLESEDAPLLSIMNLKHPNILRVEAVRKRMKKSAPNQKNLAIFVEPHDGQLALHLINLDLSERGSRVVPSQSLRAIIRQIVVALEELRVNGLYHGNLTVHNIYHSNNDGAIIVKLANFLKIAMDLKDAQLHDWVGLGGILRGISIAAKFAGPNVSCSMIDRLATKLESLTDNNCLPRIKDEILNDMFFWDTRRRTMFYIHEIPKALKNAGFLQRVRNHNWQLPWDSNPHWGLIEAMNEHREEIAIKERYNGIDPGKQALKKHRYRGNDPVHFIQCISGAYTHQEKLVGKILDGNDVARTVDVTVQKHQPDLCFILHSFLPGEAF